MESDKIIGSFSNFLRKPLNLEAKLKRLIWNLIEKGRTSRCEKSALLYLALLHWAETTSLRADKQGGHIATKGIHDEKIKRILF